MQIDKQKINNILIIRLSAIGDIVMASIVIDALRYHFPQAKITWLVQPESKNLLEHNNKLDEVITWPRNEWRNLLKSKHPYQLLKAIIHFSIKLKSRHFDLALDLQGLFKSGFLAWLSRAPLRIAIESKETSRLLVNKILPRPTDDRRISSQYIHLLSQLELDHDEARMNIGINSKDIEFANDCIQANQLEAKEFYVLCPFTTRPQKHWKDSYWLELAKLLPRPCIMLGGPGDIERAQQLCRGGNLINLVGETSLSQAYAIIVSARALIGVDTGLTHMGIASNIPVVALFGSTCPYLETPNRNAKIIYHDLSCSPCRRNPSCGGKFQCMTDIDPKEVINTLKDDQ